MTSGVRQRLHASALAPPSTRRYSAAHVACAGSARIAVNLLMTASPKSGANFQAPRLVSPVRQNAVAAKNQKAAIVMSVVASRPWANIRGLRSHAPNAAKAGTAPHRRQQVLTTT